MSSGSHLVTEDFPIRHIECFRRELRQFGL
jgi:hypothetical protein